MKFTMTFLARPFKLSFQLLAFFYFFFISESVIAQNTDSFRLTSATWVREKLAKRAFWYHFHFQNKDLFGANQNLNYLEIRQGRYVFGFGSGSDSLLETCQLAAKYAAKAAINGSFFNMKEGGAVDLIKIENKLLDTTVFTKGKRAEHQKAAIALEKKRVIILKGDSVNNKWDEVLPFSDIMVTGPLLIWNGEIQGLQKSAFNDNRHPRSCVCTTKRNTTIWLTVDGRAAESAGMNLLELSQTLLWLGCYNAVNLDGGGSTTLFIEGQPFNGVVNMPSDNKKFDHEGARKVSNILFVKF
jgi:exopolysaccharide biosynthesis protein